MLKLYKDLYDPRLTYIVCSDTQWGTWADDVDEAIMKYQRNIVDRMQGENPNLQDCIELIAEAETVAELKLEVLLSE